MGFTPAQNPQLTIYINARWGAAGEMWARLRHFASYFGVLGQWQELDAVLLAGLKPLGMALTFCEDRPTAGRIYLNAYGKHLGYYQRLMRPVTTERFEQAFRRFADHMLGDDCRYPTRSAVCSFGFSQRGPLDIKFELCGHCLFESDVEAEGKLRRWLESAGIDPAAYLDMLEVVADGRLSGIHPDLHCYVGVGLKQEMPYSSIYLKPRIIRSRDRL